MRETLLAACAGLSAHPVVLDAVEQAREAVAELARHRVNRRGWSVTAAAATVRAARASAVLDGCADPDCAVPDSILAGALRAQALVPRCAGIWRRAPGQALATLHVAAAGQLGEPTELGRPVRPVAYLPQLLEGFTAHPGPVAVALVHGYLRAFAVFSQANGVTARAAARVVMVASGLDAKGLSVPEVGALRDPGYDEAVAKLRAAILAGDRDGLAIWVQRVCGHLVRGAAEGRGIAEAAAV